MQLHTALFLGVQAVASGYALRRGGPPERVVAMELALGTAISAWLPFRQGASFHGVEDGRLLLDLMLLIAVLPVALRANRFWPLWVAAVQLDAIAMHGVRAFDPSLRASVYFAMTSYAAYPILILLAVGTLQHRKREARAGAGEAAWIT